MFKFEELQSSFINAYCAWHLICNAENDIARILRKALPKEVSNKIHTVALEQDPDGFLQLRLHIFTKDLLVVKTSLQSVFPSFEWECYISTDDFSYIWLRLDYDALYDVPFYLSD